MANPPSPAPQPAQQGPSSATSSPPPPAASEVIGRWLLTYGASALRVACVIAILFLLFPLGAGLRTLVEKDVIEIVSSECAPAATPQTTIAQSGETQNAERQSVQRGSRYSTRQGWCQGRTVLYSLQLISIAAALMAGLWALVALNRIE